MWYMVDGIWSTQVKILETMAFGVAFVLAHLDARWT